MANKKTIKHMKERLAESEYHNGDVWGGCDGWEDMKDDLVIYNYETHIKPYEN